MLVFRVALLVNWFDYVNAGWTSEIRVTWEVCTNSLTYASMQNISCFGTLELVGQLSMKSTKFNHMHNNIIVPQNPAITHSSQGLASTKSEIHHKYNIK